jgi:hypothetical protein
MRNDPYPVISQVIDSLERDEDIITRIIVEVENQL